MSWKIFIFQSVVFLLLTYLTALYFSFLYEENLTLALRQTDEHITQLEQRLDQVKKSATQTPEQQPVTITTPVIQSDSKVEEQVATLAERLERLEKREKQLWQATADLIRRQNVLVRAQRQTETESVRVRDWMSTLDTEKREQVQATYREEMEEMQNTVSASPDAPPPSPETMFRLLQESRERLKLKLKDILTEKEYQAFLQSLEAADTPGLPLPPH